MKYIICKKCGWIHFSKSEGEIRDNLNKFQDYLKNLDEKTRNERGYENFCIEEEIEKQKKCFRCGSASLRLATETERPQELSTIQSIIFEK